MPSTNIIMLIIINIIYVFVYIHILYMLWLTRTRHARYLFIFVCSSFCSPFLPKTTAASLIHISFELHLYSPTQWSLLTLLYIFNLLLTCSSVYLSDTMFLISCFFTLWLCTDKELLIIVVYITHNYICNIIYIYINL